MSAIRHLVSTFIVILLTCLAARFVANPYSTLRIFAPKEVVYGQRSHVLVSIEDIGEKPFLLNVSTTSYIIALFITDPYVLEDIGQWHLTLDLNVELKRYALSEKRAPYKYAFYHLCEVNFWLVGEHEITAQIRDDNQSPQPAQRRRNITVLQPENVQCVPEFYVSHCKRPFQPMYLDTAVPQYFSATIKSHCAYDDFMIYKWKLRDLTEQTVIANLGRTAKPTVAVPSYYLKPGKFESNTINGSALFVLHVLALGYYEEEVGAARCYVVLQTRPIKAIIAGGLYRSVKAGWKVFLSGRPSRDYSQPPGTQTNLLYQWMCSSTDDPTNEACRNINGRGYLLKLKHNALQLGKKYNFTLTVRSRTSEIRISSTSQIITVVSTPQVYLTILCRANCEVQRFEKGEPVSLTAKCLNCFPKAVNTYEWISGGTMVDKDSTGTEVSLETPMDILGVEVKITSKYGGHVYVGTAVMKLLVNAGPTGGSCTVSPTIGYEYHTNFFFTCNGYQTEFKPIEYRFFADDILIYRCAARRRVMLALPKTQLVHIMVCDIFDVCSQTSLSVTINSLSDLDTDTMNNNSDIDIEEKSLASRIPGSRKTMIRDHLTRGDWTRGMLLTYITGRSYKEIVEAELLDLLDERIENMDQLEQMLTVVHKWFIKMRPFDDDKFDYFTKMLGRVVTNFGYIVEYISSWEIHKHSFFRVSIKLLHFISDFSIEARRIPLTKCHADSLSWSQSLHAADEHEEIPDLNLTTMKRIDIWLRGNHYLDRAMVLLGETAAMKHLDEVPMRLKRQCCEMLLKHFEDNENHELVLDDKIHKVAISPKLLEEVHKTFDATRISFQVFRLILNRYWWYPGCRALTSSILTVNIYSERAYWNHDIFLKAHLDVYLKLIRQTPLNFRQNSNGGKNKDAINATELTGEKNITNGFDNNNNNSSSQVPSEHHIIYGSFDADLRMKIYLAMMTPNSLIAVQVLYTDLPLRIHLKTHKQPTYYEVVHSKCTTNEGYIMKSVVSINPCRMKMSKLYIAFQPDVDMEKDWPFRNFSFQLEVRECNSWRYDRPDPRWTTAECVPELQSVVDELIHCNCYVISSYSATVYYTKARILNTRREKDVRLSYPLPLIYVLLLLLLVLMRYAKFMRGPSARNLIVECSRPTGRNENGGIIVQIHTGGQWDAGTTSNITLGFYSLQLGERQYVLYQDPFNPQVRQNTTYTLRLSKKDVRLPALLIVGHDQTGMHPSWYLRSIAIYDLQHNDVQIFPVEKWITTETILMSSRAFNRAPDPLPAYSWCGKFRNIFEELFINWFSIQPVMGPWRYGTIAYIAKTRFQRSCVWISQFGATICLCTLCVHFNLSVTEQPVFNLSYDILIKVCIFNYFLSVAISVVYRLAMY